MKNRFYHFILIMIVLHLSENTYSQNSMVQTNSTGIEIVTNLEKPKANQKFDEKDLTGYLLVYF
ncbi:MAG TPA: hypothetical protein PLQ09_09520 [Prolixibacteraceae bacterium]|nr:hypothetical protein [Prolixibacteraceae bacterium]